MKHISFVAPAPFDTLSGGYIYDRRMVEGLRQAGHAVEVIPLKGAYPLTDATARASAGAALRSLAPETRLVIDGLALPAFDGQAEELAARRAVGLVHHPTALETGHSEQDRQRLRESEKRLLPLLARVIVTSEPTGERLSADFGVSKDRITAVIPGTSEAPRSAGSGGASCQILSVGTLIPRKGHDVLLRAVARLFDLDWQLSIAGSPLRDPVHARALSALAEKLGIANRVHFLGEASAADLERHWAAADVFALATHWEGYGMAIAEALKRGLPVAITSGGAAAALVPVEAGVICSVGDHEGLSKAMRRIVFSQDLRRDMAEAAWRAGQELPDWQQQVAAFTAALDHV